MVFKVAANFVLKIIGFKKGSLLLISGGISAFIVEYMEMLLEGSNLKSIAIPIVLQLFGFMLFMGFTTLDLITGIQLAYFKSKCPENKSKKRYIKSYKLYRTLWKILGILLITTMMMLLCIFLEIVDFNYGYWICLWSLTVLWLMANGFEFYSIGENLTDRRGDKPRIFSFWEKVLNAVQNKAIKKIDSSFDAFEKLEKEEDEKDTDKS